MIYISRFSVLTLFIAVSGYSSLPSWPSRYDKVDKYRLEFIKRYRSTVNLFKDDFFNFGNLQSLRDAGLKRSSSELKQLYDDDENKAMEYLQLIIEFESLENKMFGL